MQHNDNSGWTSDGYRFALGSNGSTKSYAYLRKLVSLGTVGTIEISCAFDPQQQVGTWPTFLSFGHTNGTWAAHDNAMVLQSNQKQDYLRLVDDAWTGNVESQYTGTPYANWNFRANTSSGWDGKHAAFVVDTDGHRSYAKGVRDQVKPCRTAVKPMPAALWFMGNRYYHNGVANTYYQFVGTMKAVRAYNRVLTDAEIAQNYKVDVARFDGALLTTNVVVAASDYNGDLAADAYEVYGTHTFVGAAGPDGDPNRVKVWTLRNGAWTLSETLPEASYTYDAGSRDDIVKIEFGRTSPFVMVVR